VRTFARPQLRNPVLDPVGIRRVRVGPLVLDPANHAVEINGVDSGCTLLEFEILWQLAEYPGRAVPYAFLSERIWGYKNINQSTFLKARISAIRKKLREAGGGDTLIRTIPHVGYSLESPDHRPNTAVS
jgi:two-component system, OmpR family, KDP operon response regulator KdpE